MRARRRAVAAVALAALLCLDCRRDPRPASAARAPGAPPPGATSSEVATGAVSALGPLAPPGAPARAFPAPERPVASIVSSEWSDERARDDAGEAERVLSLARIGGGMRVADIGAGKGYYTVRVSRAVGPTGRVYAEDIVPRYLAELRERVGGEGLGNVTLVLGEPHDPRLPPASVDVALLVHMYHEIDQPFGLLYNLYPALRPNASVVVVDVDRSTAAHGTPPALLACELGALGYRRSALHPLPRGSGYLALFAPPASRAELTTPESVATRRGRCPESAR